MPLRQRIGIGRYPVNSPVSREVIEHIKARDIPRAPDRCRHPVEIRTEPDRPVKRCLDRDRAWRQGYLLYRLKVRSDLGDPPNCFCTEPDDILDPEPLPEPFGGEVAVVDKEGAAAHRGIPVTPDKDGGGCPGIPGYRFCGGKGVEPCSDRAPCKPAEAFSLAYCAEHPVSPRIFRDCHPAAEVADQPRHELVPLHRVCRDQLPDLTTDVIVPFVWGKSDHRVTGIPGVNDAIAVPVNDTKDRDAEVGADMPADCGGIIPDTDNTADVGGEQGIEMMPAMVDEKHPAGTVPQKRRGRAPPPYRSALAPDPREVVILLPLIFSRPWGFGTIPDTGTIVPSEDFSTTAGPVACPMTVPST